MMRQPPFQSRTTLCGGWLQSRIRRPCSGGLWRSCPFDTASRRTCAPPLMPRSSSGPMSSALNRTSSVSLLGQPPSLSGRSTYRRPEETIMRRKRPFDRCERRWIPGRLRAEILLRQDGRCAACGTRLILGFFVFDHRPPLALREQGEDANDPERLAAICWTCNEQKTPKDLKEIARAKRLAEEHQPWRERMQDKVPG